MFDGLKNIGALRDGDPWLTSMTIWSAVHGAVMLLLSVYMPLLVAVIAGVRPALRRRELEPLAWFTLAWLAFGIAVVDPRDGVRFAVPAMLLVAIVAAEGLKVLRVGWIGAAALAALSIFYTFPLLRERVTTPSFSRTPC